MKKCTLYDKEKSVEIILETFRSNPSVNFVIGSSGNQEKKIKRLAEYAFIKALNRNGAYLSENKMGTTYFYVTNNYGFNLREFFYEIRFALSIPLSKTIQTLKREAYIKKNRAYKNYCYFWFLGVKKGGGNAGFQLKELVFKTADEKKLPILLETSVKRNVKIYERYGFKVYHVWSDQTNNINLWFMKKEPTIN